MISRRTIIVGLDMAHEVLQKRLGKGVTPETINNYLEILNHAMPGAAGWFRSTWWRPIPAW